MTDLSELLDLPRFEPPPPEDYEGWKFRTVPWVRHDYWNEFCRDIIGVENILMLTRSDRTDWDGGPFVRGTMFISPGGMERLRARVEARKATTSDGRTGPREAGAASPEQHPLKPKTETEGKGNP